MVKNCSKFGYNDECDLKHSQIHGILTLKNVLRNIYTHWIFNIGNGYQIIINRFL